MLQIVKNFKANVVPAPAGISNTRKKTLSAVKPIAMH